MWGCVAFVKENFIFLAKRAGRKKMRRKYTGFFEIMKPINVLCIIQVRFL